MNGPLGWIERAEHDGDIVVSIHGEVDLSNVDQIAMDLEAATEGRRDRYFIDLSPTTYLDSSGIRVLFALASRLRTRRQELTIIVPETGPTRRVLELTDLPRLIPTLTSLPGTAV